MRWRAATFAIRRDDLLHAARPRLAARLWRRAAGLALAPCVAAGALLARRAVAAPWRVEAGVVIAVLLWLPCALAALPLAYRLLAPRRIRALVARQPATALLTTIGWHPRGLVLASPRGTLRLGWDAIVAAEERGGLLLLHRARGTPLFVPLAVLSPRQRAELLSRAPAPPPWSRSRDRPRR
ncbi:YcxB family protein [Sphingomonas sp. BK235]|uniref:YcxB family protein n=1 Tax=Sphingomonas sp. BK235 TaxID=2512131 RepID=UPI001049B077|nr:YcxB family protein [Sphingomonas sp. BK235]TCP34323.1 hypothetical protein EV292_104315 [Sphingomonas sp. BK235]